MLVTSSRSKPDRLPVMRTRLPISFRVRQPSHKPTSRRQRPPSSLRSKSWPALSLSHPISSCRDPCGISLPQCCLKAELRVPLPKSVDKGKFIVRVWKAGMPVDFAIRAIDFLADEFIVYLIAFVVENDAHRPPKLNQGELVIIALIAGD